MLVLVPAAFTASLPLRKPNQYPSNTRPLENVRNRDIIEGGGGGERQKEETGSVCIHRTVGLGSQIRSLKICRKPWSSTRSALMSYSLATHTAAVLRTYGSCRRKEQGQQQNSKTATPTTTKTTNVKCMVRLCIRVYYSNSNRKTALTKTITNAMYVRGEPFYLSEYT